MMRAPEEQTSALEGALKVIALFTAFVAYSLLADHTRALPAMYQIAILLAAISVNTALTALWVLRSPAPVFRRRIGMWSVLIGASLGLSGFLRGITEWWIAPPLLMWAVTFVVRNRMRSAGEAR